jgi:hypothetical protein
LSSFIVSRSSSKLIVCVKTSSCPTMCPKVPASASGRLASSGDWCTSGWVYVWISSSSSASTRADTAAGGARAAAGSGGADGTAGAAGAGAGAEVGAGAVPGVAAQVET